MKKYIIFLFLSASVYILIGCEKDEKEYYSALGIIHIANDSVVIESDEGNRLLVNNRGSISTAIKDKDRVVTDFSLVNKTLPAGIDYIVDIYFIDKVLYKPVINLTIQNSDSIGNDELQVSSLWLAKDFLNLNFNYYGNNKTHLINLIRHDGEISSDTVNLEIRHNNNSDNQLYNYYGFVSFDLKAIQNNDMDSVILSITAKEYNDHTYKKYLIYKY